MCQVAPRRNQDSTGGHREPRVTDDLEEGKGYTPTCRVACNDNVGWVNWAVTSTRWRLNKVYVYGQKLMLKSEGAGMKRPTCGYKVLKCTRKRVLRGEAIIYSYTRMSNQIHLSYLTNPHRIHDH